MVKALDCQSKVHGLKTLGSTKVNSVFYPYEVDQMNKRNPWETTLSLFYK